MYYSHPGVIQGIKAPLFTLGKLALLLLATLLELFSLLVHLVHCLACLPLVRFARLYTDSRANLAAFLGCITNLALGICPVGGTGSNLVSTEEMSV